MLDRSIMQSAVRLLYFDELPSSCMRAIDAADDIRLPIQAASHPEALNEACRTFNPSAVLAVLRPGDELARRVIAAISDAGPQLPILIAGDMDISLDQTIVESAASLGLDIRGTVRLSGSLRDLQLALLCAISRLRGGPIT